MDITVSIIVPVYNAKKCLKRCIDSIMNQTYKNFELILVNDGSTDGSDLLCNNYACKYTNIQVFHQPNAGVSNARNTGIDHAQGKYLTFIDADDYVGPDFLFLLIPKHASDFVYANSYYVGRHPCIADEEYKAYIFDKLSFEKYFCKIPLAKLSPWNKLYRRSIVEYYHIRFNEKLYYGEDTLFVLEFLNHCDSVLLCGLSPYYYDDSNNKYKNITHGYLLYWLENCIMSYSNIISKWESSFVLSDTLNAVVSFQRNNYYWILKSLVNDSTLSISQKNEIVKKMHFNLIPKQNTKLTSKKEKLIEFLFSMPSATLLYCFFKIVSLIK